MELPTWRKSRTDKLLPIFATPYTDMLDPARIIDRSDKLEPRCM
jgi:hypothetical protein